MVKKYVIFTALLFVGSSLVGCTYHSRLKEDYGNSHGLVVANQKLDPEAGKSLEPVSGVDGIAAEKTMGKYQKGFEKTEAPSLYTIGAVGSLGAQSQ